MTRAEDSTFERAAGAMVQEAKRELQRLVPDAFRPRSGPGGFTMEEGAERAVKWLEDHEDYAPAQELRAALEAYQNALNELWGYGLERGLHEAAVRAFERQPGTDELGARRDDAVSEAGLALRRACGGFDPSRQGRFSSYVYRILIMDLMTWRNRDESPVELPRGVARDGHQHHSASLEAADAEMSGRCGRRVEPHPGCE